MFIGLENFKIYSPEKQFFIRFSSFCYCCHFFRSQIRRPIYHFVVERCLRLCCQLSNTMATLGNLSSQESMKESFFNSAQTVTTLRKNKTYSHQCLMPNRKKHFLVFPSDKLIKSDYKLTCSKYFISGRFPRENICTGVRR